MESTAYTPANVLYTAGRTAYVPQQTFQYYLNMLVTGFPDLQAHENRWPLPSPRLLALHAAIGNIWHASGMTGYVEGISREPPAIER